MSRTPMKRFWAILMAFAVVISGMMAVPKTAEAAVRVSKITLSAKRLTIAERQSVTLKVKSVTPKRASKKVSWKSSNAKVATVGKTNGRVTGKKAGTATITATSAVTKTKRATCRITVVPRITKVTFKKTAYSVRKGAKLKLAKEFVVTPTKGIKTASWKSSKRSVATVDAKGTVTGRNRGTTNITATATDGSRKKVTAKLVVTDNRTKKAKSIKLNARTRKLNVRGTFALRATVAPAAAKRNVVSYKSSRPAVATVATNGKVTALAKGTTVITATVEDGSRKSAKCTITVEQPVTSVRVTPTTANVVAGKTVQLRATVVPSNASNTKVTWTSSNTRIATVNANGLVTGKAPGTATITAKSVNGKVGTSKITVNAATVPVTSVKITGDAKVKNGQTITLTATVNPSNATNQNVNWTSSDPAIAAVAGNGKTATITGKAVGTATITLTSATNAAIKATLVVEVLHADGEEAADTSDGDTYKVNLDAKADSYRVEDKLTGKSYTMTNTQVNAVKDELKKAVVMLGALNTIQEIWAKDTVVDELLKSIVGNIEVFDKDATKIEAINATTKRITVKTAAGTVRTYTAVLSTVSGKDNITLTTNGGKVLTLSNVVYDKTTDASNYLLNMDLTGASAGVVPVTIKLAKDGSAIEGIRNYTNSSPRPAFKATITEDAFTFEVNELFYAEFAEKLNIVRGLDKIDVFNVYGTTSN